MFLYQAYDAGRASRDVTAEEVVNGRKGQCRGARAKYWLLAGKGKGVIAKAKSAPNGRLLRVNKPWQSILGVLFRDPANIAPLVDAWGSNPVQPKGRKNDCPIFSFRNRDSLSFDFLGTQQD